MEFWDRIADAGDERYLKSYCFGTNISAPKDGNSFADFSSPRGLEIFEPCSMAQFAAYGHWFQKKNVPQVQPLEVERVARSANGFDVTIADGERFEAAQVVVATGLAGFAYVPPAMANLPSSFYSHTSDIKSFATFTGLDVAVIGAGQSALEAAALLHEVGARPQLLVREDSVLWQTRVSLKRSIWRKLRSPISGLGTGPKAWMLTNFPGVLYRLPATWRTDFVKKHLPAEGAWWLRDRVEGKVPIQLGVTVVGAGESARRVALELRHGDGIRSQIVVDHVIAGSGYHIDVERLQFIDPKLRCAIERLELAPRLNASFESSMPGLYFIGPTSAMSFGPLFRFVVGAEYTVRVVSAHLATRTSDRHQ
jgi:hypothetical protein